MSLPFPTVFALMVGVLCASACGQKNQTVGGGEGLTLTFTPQNGSGFDGTMTIPGASDPADPIRPEEGAWVSLQVNDFFTVRGEPAEPLTLLRTLPDGTTEDVMVVATDVHAFADEDLNGLLVFDGLPSLSLSPFDPQTWSDDFRTGSATSLVSFTAETGDTVEESELTIEWAFDTELATWRESSGVGGVVEGPG